MCSIESATLVNAAEQFCGTAFIDECFRRATGCFSEPFSEFPLWTDCDAVFGSRVGTPDQKQTWQPEPNCGALSFLMKIFLFWYFPFSQHRNML